MRKAILIVCVAAVAAALAVPAQATIVRNGTTNIFVDTYEGPNGVNPNQPTADNGALPGDWANGNLGGFLVREQGWNVETPNPAAEGTQVVGQFSTGVTGGPGADLGAWASFSTQNSGTIVVDTMIYLWPTASNDRTYGVFELENVDHSGRAYAILITKLANGDMRISDDFSGGGSLPTLSPLLQPGQWQRLMIEYELGSTDLTVTLDGTSETINNIGSGGISAATHLDIRGANQQFFYLDAVPEPGTLSLLALGGLMILRRSRRA